MEIFDSLNQEQLEAVKTIGGPIMIIAGPGSGKTRVLTHKIAYLLMMKIPAQQILALTFTNKAASEMKNRIHQLVGNDSNKIWMGTFHSIFARILRIECEKLGFQKNFSIYDVTDSMNLLKDTITSLNLPLQQFNPRMMHENISQFKNKMISPMELDRSAENIFEEKIAAIYKEYQNNLKRNNAMDFDDLLLKPIELFSKNKSVLDKYQARFRYVLIDEYQDTNRAQYILIKNLVKKHRNVCVVGDDAQSIYSFRGADIRNILEFEKDYPDTKVIRLEQNYRSTKTILSAADQVIKYNYHQISKNLWTNNPEGDPIMIINCYDDKDEGFRIVDRISYESHRLKIDFKDFAIMYRTNAQSRSLEDALRKSNIPYTIVGGIEFYQRKEIKDVLAYLRLLVNPQDNESFLRIVNYPVRGVGERSMSILKNYVDKHKLNLLEAAVCVNNIFGISNKAKNGLHSFYNLYKKYQALLSTMTASELSRALVDEIGILKMFKEEGGIEARARWENVQELLSAISEFSFSQPEGSIASFLQEVSLVSDIDQWDDKHNMVTLMTLHSAKGLEFPVVFISGLEEGLLPYYNSNIEQKDLEEERRLFYVGISRAIKKLYLTHTNLRYRFGEVTYPTPSRFFEEIKSDSIEIINEIHKTRGKNRDDKERSAQQYFSDDVPDYESSCDLFEQLHVGSKVKHHHFGSGTVIIISGNGDYRKATVDFQSVGRKNLLLKFANLVIE